MNEIIKYYQQVPINPILLKQKLSKFEKHSDIAEEFEYWIQHGKYKLEDCVEIEGYTAKKLGGLSELVDGEAAFLIMIELRENPNKAIDRIEAGFYIK